MHPAADTAAPPLRFVVPGRPRAVQSVRFARVGGFLRKYQPQDVIDWKRYVAFEVRRQLPPGFRPFEDAPLAVRLVYRFAPPKSWPKRYARALAAGSAFYKPTKPDLADNLNKGLLDALTGVLWRDDALIAAVASRKVYTAGAEETVIEVKPLRQGEAPAPGRRADGAGTGNDSTGAVFCPPDASALPLFAGNAVSRPGEAPRSAPRLSAGQLPPPAPARALAGLSGDLPDLPGFPGLRDCDPARLVPVPVVL